MSSTEPSEIKIKELISLFNKKNFDELLRLSNELLNKFPKSILLLNIKGVVHTELKDYKLAKNLFIKVLNLNPKFTDGYYNLANIFSKLNEEDKAIESYNKVLELDKNYFKAHNNLGNIYRKKGLNKKAIQSYISTLEINPDYKTAYYNLSAALQFYIINQQNKYINKYLLFLLKQREIVRPNSISINVLNGLYFNTDLKKTLSIIKNKNTEKVLNYAIESLDKNTLLLQFMKVCPIPDYYIEKKFIKIRKQILDQILKSKFDKKYINFLISLSTQCFLNEYIYEQSKDEINKIDIINKRIIGNLEKKKMLSDLEILSISCYAPLHKFSWSKMIYPSNELKEVFELHLKHNEIEKKLSRSIKSISKIKNKISVKVKKQYEENPYPRWINLGLSIEPKNTKQVIKDINLNIDLKELNLPEYPEILIAGCGTGQHAITTASKYRNAKIFALDLSFKSLSYAKRKAEDLNIKNINFIQGDLLDLKFINKKFDIIETVGVLHHMDDPFNGLKTLTECLKHNSLILIGLYSEKARQHISQIKNKINELSIEPNAKNIIKFRREIFESNNNQWKNIKSSPDFYSVSGVRDLLFHVQEHQFTISKIKRYLKKLELAFLGFEDKLVKEMFNKIYNNKLDLYDLDKWENFENNNPRIFAGMYQFWCKKLKI